MPEAISAPSSTSDVSSMPAGQWVIQLQNLMLKPPSQDHFQHQLLLIDRMTLGRETVRFAFRSY